MSDLFSTDPQFRRSQYTKLSDNVKAWPEEVSALVQEHLPPSLGLDVSVVFQKVDQQKGYAIGTAIVRHPNAGKQVGIPIIVKAWHAAPFDLYFEDERVRPLTPDAIAREFFEANVGVGLAPVKPPPTMYDDQTFENRFPPLGAKYASVAEAVLPARAERDIAALRAAVNVAPMLIGKFAEHRTMKRLSVWAAKPEAAAEEEREAKNAARVLTVKKDGPDEYRIFANDDEVYEPMFIRGDRHLVRDLAELRHQLFGDADDMLRMLDRNGEVTLTRPKDTYGEPLDGPKGNGVDGSGGYGAALNPRRSPFLFNPLRDDCTVVQADRLGRYGVTDRSGVMAKGWVFPKVVGFDGKATGFKLFLGGALSALQHRIAGIHIDDDLTVTLPLGELAAGKAGTLVSPKAGLATVPFTILHVTVSGGERRLGIVDYAGTRTNLIPSAHVDGIVPLGDSNALGTLLGPGKNYLISEHLVFVPLRKMTTVSESTEDFHKVAAEHALDATPLKISMAGNRYVFRGGALDKYAGAGLLGLGTAMKRGRNLASQVALKSADATRKVRAMVEKAAFDVQALERHEAAFLLGSWGLPQEKIAQVLDESRSRIVTEVHRLRYPGLPVDKTASPARQKLAASMRAPMGELVKAAAMLEDADTVDAVLSLGFVTPENIERFASVRPMLEELGGTLAKLLLGARLGIEDIPEEAARSAITNLQRVIDGLVKLDMQAEQSRASTARGRAA